MKVLSFIIVPAIAIALLAGCNDDSKKPVANSGGEKVELPAGLIVAAAPQGAKNVVDIKKAAKQGEEIVVTGLVAGSVEPVAENRAVFTLADTTIDTCDKKPGDTCKTPWDACCMDKGDVAARTMTVQVVDRDGRPLKASLKSAGLAPLKQVTAKGTVRSVSGEGDKRIVTVDVSAIYVKG
jgi:hypothetical protein